MTQATVESPAVVTGAGAAAFAYKLLGRFQNEGVAGTFLYANDRLSPTALLDTVKAALAVEPKRPVIVAVADTHNSFWQRQVTLGEARVGVFSQNGTHGIVTHHPRPSLIGSVVTIEGMSGVIPSVFRERPKKPVVVLGGDYA